MIEKVKGIILKKGYTASDDSVVKVSGIRIAIRGDKKEVDVLVDHIYKDYQEVPDWL